MKNSLKEVHPELVSEWSEKNYPLTPETVSYGSNKVVWWYGKCGHEWKTSVKARSHGENCPICDGTRIVEGINDLVTTHPQIAAEPELAKEWSDRNLPLTPDMVNEKSRKKVWWKCPVCGFEWQSLVKSRIKGTVCPVCADRAVKEGYNDLATTDPDIA